MYIDYEFFIDELKKTVDFYTGLYPERNFVPKNIENTLSYLVEWLHEKSYITSFIFHLPQHNEILKSESDFLPTLYTNFHFDKRGEFKDGESPTTFKPIFEFGDNELKFRYLRNYIDAGQKKVNSPLSTQQNHILNKLDEVIHNEDFSVSYDLKQFDMTFFNKDTRDLNILEYAPLNKKIPFFI